MSAYTIFCPGGADSQSGAAVKERYPEGVVSDCGKIPNVPLQLEDNPGPFVIPIWNSHQGEVKAAEYVWNHIQTAKIKLTDAWPKRIEFWFVRRAGSATAYKKIGSVVVAKTQCSRFLVEQAAELVECPLTTVAFDEYRRGAAWDGVLVAPGQGADDAALEVVSRQTANPNNFTSFAQFVPSRAFQVNASSAHSWITGVTMPSFGEALGDAEQAFFEEVLRSLTDLKDIPKLIFVLKRTANVGLIFEGTRLHAGDLLDAVQQEIGDIVVHEDAGATTKHYTDELRDLIWREFPDLKDSDFILHRGVNTCLFACPPLGLYTHGYEVETVEPVVRFYISGLFQCIEDEARCTPAQIAFFKRHRNAWLDKGSEFMEFKRVGPTHD
jgi:prephenate dehydratase